MPWSAGVYTRTDGTNTGATVWQADQSQGFNILATHFDTHDQDLATGLNNCVTIDGLNKIAANFVPNADATYTIGSISVRWSTINLSNGVALFNGATNAVTVTAGTLTAARAVSFGDFAGTVVLDTATQTLTNKTLTSPTINTPTLNGSGGALTLPAGPDTLVGRATTDTLTNKTLTGPTINGAALSGTFSGIATFSGAVTHSGTVTMSGAAFNEAANGAIAAANVTDLSLVASNNIYLTGGSPLTITAWGPLPAGARRWVRNASGVVFTIQNNANTNNRGGVDIPLNPNDVVIIRGLGGSQNIMDEFNGATTLAPATVASAATTLTGTDITQALTAGGFAGNKSIGANGYYKLPGGLIIQWGNQTVSANTATTFSFPTSFASSGLSIVCSFNNSVAGTNAAATAALVSLTQFTLANSTGSSANIFWIATGI